MEFSKLTFFLLAICLLDQTSYAQTRACPTSTQAFPFQNFVLNSNCSLSANYSFAPYSVIFCYSSNQDSTGTVTWAYNGRYVSGNLPITLVVNNNYEGSLANPSGTLTVRNTSTVPNAVSCQFAL